MSRQGITYLPEYVEAKVKKDPTSRQLLRPAAWEEAFHECRELAHRLKRVNPLVIDYFLGQNPELQAIGKLLIAWVMLECEAHAGTEAQNANRLAHPLSKGMMDSKDDWCRFVIQKLTSDCNASEQLLENNVQFVTFNYDVSLEKQLHMGLRSISTFKASDVDTFFQEDRFIHIYGSIREVPLPQSPAPDIFAKRTGDPNVPYFSSDPMRQAENKARIDTAHMVSKRIRTIDPHDKIDDRIIKGARKAIDRATCVYILGYGFDRNNNERLDLANLLRVARAGSKRPPKARYKVIMFTNYRNRNQVNKKASKLFFGTFGEFLSLQQSVHGDPTGDYYVEKSIRDVYGALEFDFDDLEAQLLPTTKI